LLLWFSIFKPQFVLVIEERSDEAIQTISADEFGIASLRSQ